MARPRFRPRPRQGHRRGPMRLRAWWRRDDGSLAPAIPILLLMMFVLGGLVIDGGRDLTLRGRAQAYAEEAARYGATAVDLAAPDLELDQALALQRVRDYCAKIQAAQPGIVTVCAPEPDIAEVNPPADRRQLVVVVNVTLRMQTGLLGITGISSLSASGQAKARPFEGLDADDAH